jgi:hypothetical protein
MNASVVHTSLSQKLAILGVLLVSSACNKTSSSDNSSSVTPTAVAPGQPIAPLSANDVSWLALSGANSRRRFRKPHRRSRRDHVKSTGSHQR